MCFPAPQSSWSWPQEPQHRPESDLLEGFLSWNRSAPAVGLVTSILLPSGTQLDGRGPLLGYWRHRGTVLQTMGHLLGPNQNVHLGAFSLVI